MSKPPAFGNQPPAPVLGLAESIRGLVETMLRVPRLSPEAAAEVERTRTALDALERTLAPHALHDPVPRMGPEPETQRPYFVSGVIMGPHHPLRPELRITHDDGLTHGTVRFGVTFEGPPGCVHGGFVAAAFDEVLGFVQSLSGSPGFTGTLTVRYRNPTPLHTELRFQCELLHTERRKIFTEGRMLAGDLLCAEAEAIFVSAKPGKFDDLLEKRQRLEDGFSTS